jgi:membrane protease YdiL (CAAX protease family)
MPEPEHIVIGLIFMACVFGSAWTWWQTVGTGEPPFWKVPPQTPLPSHTPMLFLAGGILLIGKMLVAGILGPLLVKQFAGPVLDDPLEFDSARVNLSTQINAGISLLVIIIGFAIVFTRSREDRRSLGFQSDDLIRQSRFGLQGFLLAFVPVYLLVLAVSPFKQTAEAVHPLLRLVADGYLFWPIVAAVLIAPIQEELLYRVLLQEGLVAAGYPIERALPAVAVFFSFIHFNPSQPSPDFIALFPLALLFGATLHYRRSFLACVLMHMLFNGFNIGLALLGGTMP